MESIFQDIPRTYTALAEWCSCMMFLLLTEGRVRGGRFILRSAAAMLILTVFLVVTDDFPRILWIPCMLAAVALMLGFLLKAGNLSLMSAGYCCAGAFLWAEFAASLEWQINTFLIHTGFGSWWQQLFLLIIVYSMVFFCEYRLECSLITKEYLNQLTKKELLAAIGTVAVIFAFSNLSFIVTNSPFTSKIQEEVFNIRTLIDLGGVAILYAFQSRISEYMTEKEMAAIRNILKSQYTQYRDFQNSLELIQMRNHDMKHQIAGLRAETDAEKRKEWLDALEQELEITELADKTGNSVLDTILGTKVFLAKRNQVRLTCVADGSLLNFLHVRDICTIFGNALDNAVESVSMIKEPEKRLIHMSVTAQKNFVLIRIENYCEEKPDLVNGKLPLTTKSNKSDHGFGLKSIQYAVEKYDGSMHIGMNKNWFELRILFPLEMNG